MSTFTRYEARRAGWPAQTAIPAVLIGGVLITMLLTAKGSSAHAFVQFWLREVLPLAFGLAVAAVPGAERCTELQLSLPRCYAGTLGRRAGLCVVFSGCGALLFTTLAQVSGQWRPARGALAGQLTWMSPTLALAGVAAIVFAVSGSTAGAAAAVAGVWLVEDLTVQWFTAHNWARPIYLFLDDTADIPARWWWTNRLDLLAVAVLLVTAAAIVINAQQERIFAARLRNPIEDS
jgi:hypothetical protein